MPILNVFEIYLVVWFLLLIFFVVNCDLPLVSVLQCFLFNCMKHQVFKKMASGLLSIISSQKALIFFNKYSHSLLYLVADIYLNENTKQNFSIHNFELLNNGIALSVPPWT